MAAIETVRDWNGCLGALRALLGERLEVSGAARDHHGHDESHHPAALPDAVAFPETTEDVAAIARICSAHRVPMIPFGAGTGLEGGVTAVAGGVSIDMGRMNKVLAIHREDMDAIVQAGTSRLTLNTFLRDTGLFFPVDPGVDASLGGMAATRASGTNAVSFGTMRENVLGLTVVLADGRILRTGGRSRKSASGYDLTRLFVGSEGTLGIITEVTLRLHPIPDADLVAVATFPTLSDAVKAVTDTMQAGIAIGRVELLDDDLMAVVRRHSDIDFEIAPTLIFEFHGEAEEASRTAEWVAAIVAENNGRNFRRATTPEERSRLWAIRHDALPWARQDRPGSRFWPTDVCVPISKLPECILGTKEDLAQSSAPGYIVGHVGDGNFHCTFTVDPDSAEELADVARLNDRLVRRAIACGGTCTGEHGIGVGKRDYLELEHGAEAVAVMETLKAALDPHGLLNPGKIFPGYPSGGTFPDAGL